MTFTSNEVSQMFNITLRKLQWADERGIIKPRHHQHRRIYDEADAFEIGLLQCLREKALTLPRIRELKTSRNFRSLYESPYTLAVVDEKKIHTVVVPVDAISLCLKLNSVVVVDLDSIRAVVSRHADLKDKASRKMA